MIRSASPRVRRTALLALLALLAAGATSGAQGPTQADPAAGFARTNARIAMRDGVRLNTDIYAPKDQRGPLPIIFVRTPYGIDGAAASFAGQMKELAADGYIFVFQDIRGRYHSEGRFVMQRPPRDRATPGSVDETSDAYDTIEWLVAHVPDNNGRVGMLGVSYPGWLTAVTLLGPHPALKAISPQASPADMFLGDDFHHNGAFRLSYGFEYAAMMETSKENTNFAFDTYDTFDWYLRLGALSHVNERILTGKIPTWNDFVAHPNYDRFWQRQSIITYIRSGMDRVPVPTLNVAGWWDQEDFYGPIAIYSALERLDHDHKNYLVVGPWNHGGWSRGEGRSLGRIDFDSPTAQHYRAEVQAPWFAYWLKDKGTLRQPEALTFEGGANQWKSYDAWPPATNITERKLYVHPGGKLSFEAPVRAADCGLRVSEQAPGEGVPAVRSPQLEACRPFDSYVSDPAHPVPYRPRPIEPTYFPGGSGWYTWLLEDQRFADSRPDVLTWRTGPLTADVTVTGDIVAHLFASTSGTDSDWIVKLIDVFPERYDKNPKLGGYELMVSNEVFRGRFRTSFERPSPITPNVVQEYTIGLHGQDYRFGTGHRIMVQVQSTWFPIIDRNPQTFVPNIFAATDADFRSATQRIYRSPQYPTHLVLPVQSATP